MADLDWLPTDEEVPASVEDIDRELHDAWLDFDSVMQGEGCFSIAGEREWPIPKRWFLTGRYPVLLRFRQAERVELSDPDHLGGVIVCSATLDEEGGSIKIESCLVGSIVVVGKQVTASLTLAGKPAMVRRPFGGWHQPGNV